MSRKICAYRIQDFLTGDDLIKLWNVSAQDIVDFMKQGYLEAYKYMGDKNILQLKYKMLPSKNKPIAEIKSDVSENIVILNIGEKPIIIGGKINYRVLYRLSEEIIIDKQIKRITKSSSHYRPPTEEEQNIIAQILYTSQPDTYFLPVYRDKSDFSPLLKMFAKDVQSFSEELKELYFLRDKINSFAEKHCLPLMDPIIDKEIIMTVAKEQERTSGKQTKADNFFTRENSSLWHIGFEGKNEIIKHVDGLLYIGYLLDQLRGPKESISCMELYHAALRKTPNMTISEDEAKAQDLSVVHTKQAIGTGKERKICLAQYEKLQEKLHTANIEEQEDIKEQMSKFEPYLNSKERNFADPNDKKVQANIKKRLNDAYKVLREANMEMLAKHLRNSIRPDGAYGLTYVGAVNWKITIK